MSHPSAAARTAWSTLALSVLLLGCAEEKGTLNVDLGGTAPAVDDTDTLDTVDVGCANPVVDADPADGTLDVPIGATVRIAFARPEPDATLRVRSGARDVSGRVDVLLDGAQLRFTPLQLVRADAPYETRVRWSCGEAVLGWRTTASVARLGVDRGRVVEPTTELALASALGPWLVQLDGAAEDRLEVRVAPADGFGQDLCAPTFAAGGARRQDGRFDVAADVGWVPVAGAPTRVTGVRLVGDADPTVTRISDVRLALTVDARVLAPALLGAGTPSGAVCGEVAGGCSPCPDGVVACVALAIDQIPVETGREPVVLRSEVDVADDEACDDL